MIGTLHALISQLVSHGWPKSWRRLWSDSRAIEIIGKSRLFDAGWYVENYQDVAARGADALQHYVKYGAREGRDPNRVFNSTWYLASYRDVIETGVNPLAHYILRGASEGRNPSPLFDTSWYLEANPDVAAAGINPLLHFLRHGAREGRRPNRRVDSAEWMPSTAQIGSPHDRNALRKAFDGAAARAFIARVRAGAGHRALTDARPLVSIIMPTRNRAALLSAAIQSVRSQTYDHWELLIVDDGSTDDTQAIIEGHLSDHRIRSLHSDGAGVAAARNKAMASAQGDFFAYLDSDNAWRPEFLEVAASFLLENNLDLVYSALETNDGWRTRFVGADYDETALSRRNFIDINVVLHRRALYDARGGCDETLRRMSDWDLIVRYARSSRVAYAPFIGCLYDARLTRSDRITVSEPASWTYVVLAKHHLNWPRLQAELGGRDPDLVSIIVPVHGQPELTATCLAALFGAEAVRRFELVLVDNDCDAATAALLDECAKAHANVRIVRNWENLNFALGCNLGFAATRGEIVVFLNNDTRVTAGWLQRLVTPLSDPGIGAVQPKLLFPDGTVQTFGTVIGAQGHIPYELYRGLPGDAPHLANPRRLAMVSGACLAMRAVDFSALRGFDPIFINGQEDNDLCLRLRAQTGKGCLVEPSSVVIHHERGTPGRDRFAFSNRRIFVERWKDQLTPDDEGIYRQDGYRTQLYVPDVPEWAPAGLASFRPVLEYGGKRVATAFAPSPTARSR